MPPVELRSSSAPHLLLSLLRTPAAWMIRPTRRYFQYPILIRPCASSSPTSLAARRREASGTSVIGFTGVPCCLSPRVHLLPNVTRALVHVRASPRDSVRIDREAGCLTGLEPATFRTTTGRSDRLSYRHHAGAPPTASSSQAPQPPQSLLPTCRGSMPARARPCCALTRLGSHGARART